MTDLCLAQQKVSAHSTYVGRILYTWLLDLLLFARRKDSASIRSNIAEGDTEHAHGVAAVSHVTSSPTIWGKATRVEEVEGCHPCEHPWWLPIDVAFSE
jgi:hypothetical protein